MKALEIIVAYGYGKQTANVTLQAKGGPLDSRFAGAARAMLEAAIEQAETDTQTVPLGAGGSQGLNDSGVIDVTGEPVTADRGEALANGIAERGTP